MGKLSSNVLACLLGGSATLGGLMVPGTCDGGGCHSCCRCAGVGVAVVFAALCYRGRRRAGKQTEITGPASQVASPASIAELRAP